MPDSFTNEKIDSAIGRTLARRSISPVRVPQGTALKLDEAVQSVTTDKNTLLNLSYNKAVQDDNPDREAEIQSLSKSTGLPHRTIRQNLERVQQQTKSRRFQSMDMVKEFPHLSRYMSKRDNARLVTDDLERLQELEKLMAPAKPSTTKRIAKGMAGSFVSGLGPTFAQGVYGVGENIMLLADQFVGESFRQLTGGLDLPFSTFAEGFGGLRQRAKTVEKVLAPEITAETGRLERAAFSAARSVGLQLPSLGLAVLARDPRIALGTIGVATGGLEAGRALDIGADPVRAAYLGLVQGGAEVVFEAAPVFRLLNDLKVGSTLGKTLLNQLLVEVPSEMATTVVQNFNDWALLNPQKPFSEYLAQLPNELVDTVLSTTMSVGMQTTMLHTVNRFVADQGETERVEAQGEMLDNMDKLANDSKLRERSVDSFEEFVKDAAEDGPMQDVYIDAEVLNQSGLDLEGMSDEVKSQMQTGADIDTPVRIPIEEYAARIAGQEGSKKLLEHLKMNPNDISRAEMKTAKKEQDAELQAEVEEILTTSQEEILFEDSKQAVEDKVFGELEKAARFTEDVNRADAVLASSYYAVQAERLGTTPEAMFERYPLKVRAEDTPGFSFEQEGQRGTPEFNQWFGESKVVNTEGKPLVVYHGTTAPEDFAEFGIGEPVDPSNVENEFLRTGSGSDPTAFLGSHFAKEQSIAAKFARGLYGEREGAKGGRVYPVYLSMKNPFVTTESEMRKAMLQGNYIAVEVEEVLFKLEDQGGISPDQYDSDVDFREEVNEEALEAEQNREEPIPELAQEMADKFRADLIAHGFDGIIYENEIEGGTSYVAFEPTQIKSAISNIGAFDITDPSILKQDKRGAFAPSARTIILLEDADLSTFLHEFGHFMLETQFDISIQENAPQEIKDDMDALFKWFNVKGKTPLERSASWGAMTLKEKTKSHEKLATGFEAYLFQGKAPSSELRKVFQRFRAWLVSIYKKLKNINVKLTPEVTQVFDRMLATDAAIEETERLARYGPLFKSAEQANMTPEEFIDYQQQGADATLDAIETLDTRNLRDMKWLSGARSRGLKKMQAEAKAKRRQIAIEVMEEVLNEPVYRAMQFLKRGLINGEKVAEGTQHKLSTKFVKAMLGAEEYSALRGWFGKFGLLAEDGMHPDVAAEMFGYTSGDQLLTELQNAEVMKDKIEGITDQRMLERHGELVDPDAIEIAVMESLKNKTRVKFIEAEVTALNKAAGRKAFLAKAARQLAEDIINRQQIKSLRPHQYEAAETKAAREKEKAFRKGDVELAAMNGRNQLINLYAGKGARTALTDVKKGLTYTKNLVRKLRRGRKFLDADVRDQLLSLLDQYDMQRISTRELERRISLREWVKTQENIGNEPDIPQEILEKTAKISYKELTVEEFNGLIDTIKQIEHIGKRRNTLLTARQQRDFDKAKTLMVEAIVENAPKKEINLRTRTNVGGKLSKGNKQFHALHRKMASLLQRMDGREGGPLWEYIVRVVNEAGDNETVMREEATIRLAKMIDPVIDKEDIGGKGVLYPELGLSLNREEVMSIVLNLGNEGNKQRLLSGEGWSEAQLQPLLNSLSKEETVFIQAVWDHFQSYKPQVATVERRILGREPKWVEPIPVETPHGILRGGYYPIRYDPERSTAAQLQDDVAEAERQTKNAFVSSAPRMGMVKGRAAKVEKRPLLYSFQTIFQATEEVIHYLTHREMLIDVNKILRDKDIEAAILTHYGPEAFNITIKSAIQDIARGNEPAQNVLESVVNHLRKGSTIAALAWSVTVSGLQPIGITNSVVRIGGEWVAKGLITVAKNPLVITQQIYSKSSFMRFRPKTLDREINEIQNTIQQPGPVKRQVGKVIGRQNVRRADELMRWSLFQFIQKTQFIIDVITWQGAYEKHIADEQSDARASALADQAVIDSQGSGMIKDQAAIQRGSPYQKLWTNFYSFFNLQYNLNADIKGRTKWKNPASVALAARDYALIMVIPAILGQLLRDVLTGGEDDDKWDVEEVAKRIAAEQIDFLFGTMIGIREFAAVATKISGVEQYPGAYGGPAGLRIMQATDRLATQVSQGELDDAFRRAAIDTFAIILHVPGTQVNRTLDGVQAISDGRAGPIALLGGFRR